MKSEKGINKVAVCLLLLSSIIISCVLVVANLNKDRSQANEMTDEAIAENQFSVEENINSQNIAAVSESDITVESTQKSGNKDIIYPDHEEVSIVADEYVKPEPPADKPETQAPTNKPVETPPSSPPTEEELEQQKAEEEQQPNEVVPSEPTTDAGKAGESVLVPDTENPFLNQGPVVIDESNASDYYQDGGVAGQGDKF